MDKHVEIEYKILLNKHSFNKILETYHNQITQDYVQTNYYFTHPLFNEKHYMLRIREKNHTYEMTLKKPHNKHLLEYNLNITQKEKEAFCQNQIIDNDIINLLKKEIDITLLSQQFSLTTHRYDIQLDEGILSLDHNIYLKQEDHELEFEVYNEESGYQKFLAIIQPFDLHYTHNAQSKIARALKAYEKINK